MSKKDRKNRGAKADPEAQVIGAGDVAEVSAAGLAGPAVPAGDVVDENPGMTAGEAPSAPVEVGAVAETAAQEAVRKSRNTAKDIEAVVALRLAGATYMQIEEAMGWPDQHGNRPYRICKELGIAGGRVKKAPAAAPNAFAGEVPSDADLAAIQERQRQEGEGTVGA